MSEEIEDETEESVWAETSPGVFGAAIPPHGPALPPGAYKLHRTMHGEVRFAIQGEREEPLMRFPGMVDKIIDQIQYFWSRRTVYEAMKLPYRRGILLYGPPGTGKTSVVRIALDDVVSRGGIGIFFDDIGLLEDAFETLRDIQKDVPVVVIIEDIDNFCGNPHYESRILNFLDGAAEGAGNTIFLATTNYIDKLPDRVKNRPSRFDKKFEIGFPPAAHRARYLQSLIDAVPAGLDTFEGRIPFDETVAATKGFSLAHVKELFIAVAVLGNDYKETMEALKSGITAEDLADTASNPMAAALESLSKACY